GCDAPVRPEAEAASAPTRRVGGVPPLLRRCAARREDRQARAKAPAVPGGAGRWRAAAPGISQPARQTRPGGGSVVGYSMVHVDELPGEGPTGGVRFVRRHLGAEAFGINWFEIAPNATGVEHNEEDSQQEEVNVIIEGSGVYRVDGEEIPVRRGTVMRFDPQTTRVPVAGPEGMTMVAVGARRGSYEPRGP